MLVAFTGARAGMTDEQKATVTRVLSDWLTETDGLLSTLHGDCIGADVDFHNICRKLAIRIVFKAPSIQDPKWESTAANTDAMQMPWIAVKRPYENNRNIVKVCDRLIACPPNMEFVEGSGTWYTLTHATKKGKPVTIVFPDGSIEARNVE